MDSMLRMNKNHQKHYTIGEFSKLLQIPISTLRYYDEKKMLVPDKRDHDSNYRYYAESQIYDALSLMQLRHLGMPLLEIKQLLDHHTLEAITQSLEHRARQCEDTIARLQMQQRTVEQVYEQLKYGLEILRQEPPQAPAQPQPRIEVRFCPQTTVIAEQSATESFLNEQTITAMMRLHVVIEQRNLQINGPLHVVFVDHQPERFQTGCYRMKLFFPVRALPPEEDKLERFGGFYALSGVHVGSYETLMPIYQQLLDYAAQHALSISGDPFEEYLLHFNHTDDPDHYVTRVSFPIEAPKTGKQKKL